jgi:hypothetical protein
VVDFYYYSIKKTGVQPGVGFLFVRDDIISVVGCATTRRAAYLYTQNVGADSICPRCFAIFLRISQGTFFEKKFLERGFGGGVPEKSGLAGRSSAKKPQSSRFLPQK